VGWSGVPSARHHDHTDNPANSTNPTNRLRTVIP
jgi:hypothetical protein